MYHDADDDWLPLLEKYLRNPYAVTSCERTPSAVERPRPH